MSVLYSTAVAPRRFAAGAFVFHRVQIHGGEFETAGIAPGGRPREPSVVGSRGPWRWRAREQGRGGSAPAAGWHPACSSLSLHSYETSVLGPGALCSWGAVCSLGSQAPLSKDPRVARAMCRHRVRTVVRTAGRAASPRSTLHGRTWLHSHDRTIILGSEERSEVRYP